MGLCRLQFPIAQDWKTVPLYLDGHKVKSFYSRPRNREESSNRPDWPVRCSRVVAWRIWACRSSKRHPIEPVRSEQRLHGSQIPKSASAMNSMAKWTSTNGTAASQKIVPTGQRVSKPIQLSEGFPRLAVVVVLEDAAVAVASSSPSPHVSMMESANTRQCPSALDGQSRQLLDSQGRRNNGDPQPESVVATSRRGCATP